MSSQHSCTRCMSNIQILQVSRIKGGRKNPCRGRAAPDARRHGTVTFGDFPLNVGFGINPWGPPKPARKDEAVDPCTKRTLATF